MKKYAVIVAGGSGKRMGTAIPKQFLLLDGKPILMHTLLSFFSADKNISLVVVLPEAHISTWQSLCEAYNFTIPHQVVEGGIERFFSVKKGLNSITEKHAIVAIHDGVRPFVSAQTIMNSFSQTETLKATTLAVDLKDSIRLVGEGGNSKAVDRSLYKLIQTPQTFSIELIKKAYRQEYSSVFTDDASVVEGIGEKIHLIKGEYNNIKITTPEDLVIGEAILSSL